MPLFFKRPRQGMKFRRFVASLNNRIQQCFLTILRQRCKLRRFLARLKKRIQKLRKRFYNLISLWAFRRSSRILSKINARSTFQIDKFSGRQLRVFNSQFRRLEQLARLNTSLIERFSDRQVRTLIWQFRMLDKLARLNTNIPESTFYKRNLSVSEKLIRPIFKTRDSNYPFMEMEYFHTSFRNNLNIINQTITGLWIRRKSSKITKKKAIGNRLLFITRSWGFINPLLEHIDGQKTPLQARTLDLVPLYNSLSTRKYDDTGVVSNFSELLFYEGFLNGHRTFINQQAKAVLRDFDELVNWSNTVVVDWGNQTAVLATRMLPDDANIIVRIHSYEAFTRFPLHFDIYKIRALIFVSSAILELFSDMFDEFGFKNIPKFVIPNFKERNTALAQNRTDDFGFKICMLQYATPVKDALFAISAFEKVFQQDERWRITFAGPNFEESGVPQDDVKRQAFEDKVQRLGSAVSVEGYIHNTDEWYLQHDIILSTSIREGTHESVIEACTTGCIPVFRQWPLLSAYSAVERNFPGFTGVNTPDEMAKQLLDASQNVEAFREKAIQLAKTKDIKITFAAFLDMLRKIK